MAGDETAGGSGHPFHPFEVNAPHLAYAFLGGFVVLFSLCSLFIKERLYIGEAVVSTVVGIVLGPYALNLFNPGSWGGHSKSSEVTDEITLEVTRVVIAVGVFAIGVELPKKYIKHHWKSLAFLVGPIMAWGWIVTALFMWALIPHLEFLTCLAIAACVTPTDPILAQAVVGGRFATKHVPAHIRHLLSAESGCNDGAAFPFLCKYEVALGIVIGSILGYVARKAIKFSEKRGYIDRQSFVAQYISLALLTVGILTLLGSDDLLGAFFCGTAFAWERLPIILALYKWIPDIKTVREAAFVGWFGPMGVGAIFIATLAKTDLPLAARETDTPVTQTELLAATIQPIVAFMVLCSVVCHGLSIPFFSLTRRVHSMTHTWSRQSFGDEPAWASHARRITPGESIRINRDDDGEIADDGITDRGDPLVISNEKELSRSQSNSLGSRTVTGSSGEQQDLPCQTGGGERADVEAMENGTYSPDVANRHARPGEEDEADDDFFEDEDDGRTTPILAEYREGPHLVRERKKDDADSVEVELFQNYFAKDKPTKATRFKHPQPLKHHEVDLLHEKLDHSAEHAADHVRDGGKDRVDRLGLGMMGVEETRDEAREEEERENDNERRERVLAGGEDENVVKREQSRRSDQHSGHVRNPSGGDPTFPALARSDSASSGGPVDREDEDLPHDTYGHPLQTTNTRGTQNNTEEYELGRVSSRVSAVFGGGRKKARQPSITKRFLGGFGKKSDSEDNVRPRDIEEGVATGDVDNGNLAHPDSIGRPILTPATTIQRSGSPPRHSSLRFAPDTAESSETAPGPASYKRPAPNPSLSMYRSSTLQPGSHSKAEETPKGQQYYKRGRNNPSLAMFKARTVNDTDSLNDGTERPSVSFRLPTKKGAGGK
ncbi:hypothetical protein QFC21_003100 [Naganishia friedmannii]|uniref:Uncharacterized protein n=1 Tax=Naganishia friedmannii TaxID=89922 RepID=A0ACC2VSK6_9TREE|nr:hypothetical protein QFC21_003100 [Naganishia friedmannii]